MDPLTAVSLAGTIVQFVDFSYKFIKSTHELYQDRETAVGAQASAVIDELSQYSNKLRGSLEEVSARTILSEDQKALLRISREGAQLAERLSKKLQALKVEDRRKGWKSFKQAVAATWQRDEIDAMEKQLLRYRDTMSSRLLSHLRSVLNNAYL
jgi:hypothetical protein